MPAREPSAAGSATSSRAGSRSGCRPGLALSPFRAVRYTTPDRSALARLTSPAYDLIDPASRAALERADPFNVVRLILPRRSGEPGDDAYTRAARTLTRWRADGVVAADPAPALYRYEMADGAITTRGIVGTVDLRTPSAGVILPHEDTMPGPVADRLALLTATEANFEPIVLVYDGDEPSAELDLGEPTAQLTAADGVRHTVWPIADDAQIGGITAALAGRTAVIADGHHRYTSYLRYRQRRHAAGAGAGPWDRALVYLVALGSHGLRTEAIHRVLPTLALADALRAAGRAFDTVPVAPPDPGSVAVRGGTADLSDLGRRRFLLTDGREWHLLANPDPAAVADAVGTEHSAAWRDLDVTLAHRLLIRTLWGLADDETSVRFGYDVDSTLDLVRRGGGTALLLPATPAASVLAVARHGERMPRKSTLFVPKPRTGLLLRCYYDE